MAGKTNSKWMETMIQRHGSKQAVSEFMAKLGSNGGKKSRGGGFAADVECHCNIFPYVHLVKNCAGKKGGKVSVRKSKKDN